MADRASDSPQPALTASAPPAGFPAPVEYAVAVDRYLAQAALGAASRRVYRISLAGWAWPLAGLPWPDRSGRRGARPPVIPLTLLDSPEAARRVADASAVRAAQADVTTINRELSALRGAIGWWLDMGWIDRDPTAGLRTLRDRAQPGAPLTGPQRAALFAVPASLREQTFWHLLSDTGAPAPAALALDAGDVDQHGRPKAALATRASLPEWSEQTADLMSWLLSGRAAGPVFLTDRRAGAGARPGDVCPLTRRSRMSYRRAAEIFAAATRSLDPDGRGWTLRRLRPSSAAVPAR